MYIVARKAAAVLVTLAVAAGPFASAVVPVVQAQEVSDTTVVVTSTCADTQTLDVDTNTCIDNPVATFKISGKVFNDVNNNGVHDNGEPYLKDWEVKLHMGDAHDGYNNPVVATDYTNDGGNFYFGTLAAGTYFVEEMTKDGWDQTSNDTKRVLSDDNSDVTVNFANVQLTTPTPVYVPQVGGLAVVDTVVGGTATPDQFSFSFDGLASTTFDASGTSNFYAMATGTYGIAETATSTYATTYANCTGIVVAANATSTCTIINTYLAPTPVVVTSPTDNSTGGDSAPTPVVTTSGSNGGGGGGYVASGPMAIGFVNTNTTGGGLVLGTSTEDTSDISDTPCSTPLLTTYLRAGMHNSKSEVIKLQNFLNIQMGTNIPVTGYFGLQTTAGVNTFQTKYQSDVLAPWSAFGYDGHTPTGFVYKTTQHEINKLSCANLNLPAPQLP